MFAKLAFVALLFVSAVCGTETASFSVTIYNGTTCSAILASATVIGGSYANGGGDIAAQLYCQATGIAAFPYATLATSNYNAVFDQSASFYYVSGCNSGPIFTAYNGSTYAVGTCLSGGGAPYSVKMTVAGSGVSGSTPSSSPSASSSASYTSGTGTISLFNDTACMLSKGSFTGAGRSYSGGSPVVLVVTSGTSSTTCDIVTGISGVGSATYSSSSSSSSSASQSVVLYSDSSCQTKVQSFAATSSSLGSCVPAVSGSFLFGGVELSFKSSAAIVSSSIFTVLFLSFFAFLMN